VGEKESELVESPSRRSFLAGRCIENTDKTDLAFPEMFKADRYLDLSMNTWIRHLPPKKKSRW
jgi:oxalate decarboxylase/phosphoglucose isomerase-like protein (cupin superfamily)